MKTFKFYLAMKKERFRDSVFIHWWSFGERKSKNNIQSRKYSDTGHSIVAVHLVRFIQ
jgi:hypothetical protein